MRTTNNKDTRSKLFNSPEPTEHKHFLGSRVCSILTVGTLYLVHSKLVEGALTTGAVTIAVSDGSLTSGVKKVSEDRKRDNHGK